MAVEPEALSTCLLTAPHCVQGLISGVDSETWCHLKTSGVLGGLYSKPGGHWTRTCVYLSSCEFEICVYFAACMYSSINRTTNICPWN